MSPTFSAQNLKTTTPTAQDGYGSSQAMGSPEFVHCNMNYTYRQLLLPILLVLCNAVVTAEESGTKPSVTNASDAVPDGTGQLRSAPKLFSGGVDDQGREYYLTGQPAQNSKLILTASNGFFDHGTCRASGESSLPKTGDEALIKPNFAKLDHWNSSQGTIRWHLWLAKPGVVRFNVNMRVAKESAGSRVNVAFAGESRKVTTTESSPGKPQTWNLKFEAAESGEHTLTLSAIEIAKPKLGVGELLTIDVYGPAIKGAQLLRARWRPAAVHGGYSCSTVKQSRMWVMTTRSTCDFGSYSPITTPFGYYGTSFESDRRTKGGFNFSMWAARSGRRVPPLEEMPHLLAAGSPEADFSGFGHEGSGVKLRGWTPMLDRPEVCVQALRVESDGSYDTYHGYFWNHPTKQWKLYAVGRKWNGGKAKEHLSPGSFCEIPGPPQVQRTGDLVREVRRRGWHYGEDGKWHAMDTFNCKSKGPANKFWRTTNDGEFSMSTGGMRFFPFKQPSKLGTKNALPEFLSAEATKQLFRLPADIGEIETTERGNTGATISFSMNRTGANARAEIYYGESDCLTFAKRKLHGTERNSVVSQSTQANNRSWSHSLQIGSLHEGTNHATLTGLKPKTNYFYRVLVTNDEGQVWAFKSKMFRTRYPSPAGEGVSKTDHR